MKKLFIALFMLAALATGAFAKAPGVNSKAVSHLKTAFKDAQDVEWKTKGNFLEAIFKWNGQELNAFYSTDGNYVAVSRVITLDRLPLAALQAIHQKYQDYKATEVIEFNSSEDGLSYYVSLETNIKKIILQVSSEGGTSVYKTENK